MVDQKEIELEFAISMIDQRTGTYVEFEVMTDKGISKRTAYSYMTGRAILKGWKDKIVSCAIIQKE